MDKLSWETPIQVIIWKLECYDCPRFSQCTLDDMENCAEIYNKAGEE